MISKNITCASCTRFPRTALETTGRAVCDGLDEMREWSYPACPLHINAKGEDLRARRIMVDRLRGES